MTHGYIKIILFNNKSENDLLLYGRTDRSILPLNDQSFNFSNNKERKDEDNNQISQTSNKKINDTSSMSEIKKVDDEDNDLILQQMLIMLNDYNNSIR